MFSDADLAYWANLAAIAGFIVTFIGACVGIYGYCAYRISWKRKTKALVTHLQNQKAQAGTAKKGQQTTTHLIRYVGLTEDEILKISFENKHIERVVSKDKEGNADTLYFEYKA